MIFLKEDNADFKDTINIKRYLTKIQNKQDVPEYWINKKDFNNKSVIGFLQLIPLKMSVGSYIKLSIITNNTQALYVSKKLLSDTEKPGYINLKEFIQDNVDIS